MNLRRTPLVLVFLVLLAGGRIGVAQTKTGTTIGQFLLIEPSARLAGMGNAGVTSFDDITTVFFNPAAPAFMERSSVELTHSRWLADIAYNYAAAGLHIGENQTATLTVTSLNSGEIDVRTVDQPLGTGERYTVQDVALGVGYGRRLSDRFAAGIVAQYVQQTIWHSSLKTASFSFGVLYQLPFRAYLGASLSHFGTRGRFDGRDLRVRFDGDPTRYGDNSSLPAALTTQSYPLPILFRVGLGFPVQLTERQRITFVVDAMQPSDNTNAVNLGTEYVLYDVLSLRAGYQNLFQQDSETGLTLGAGVRTDLDQFGFHFDYAWNNYGLLISTQRLTFGVTF